MTGATEGSTGIICCSPSTEPLAAALTRKPKNDRLSQASAEMPTAVIPEAGMLTCIVVSVNTLPERGSNSSIVTSPKTSESLLLSTFVISLVLSPLRRKRGSEGLTISVRWAMMLRVRVVLVEWSSPKANICSFHVVLSEGTSNSTVTEPSSATSIIGCHIATLTSPTRMLVM